MRRLFSQLYDTTRRGASHSRAPWLLGALSFAESSFFPVGVKVEPWLRTYITVVVLMLVVVYLRL